MLQTLQIDAMLLIELAADTLSNVALPGCVDPLDLERCHKVGVYRGKNNMCMIWDFAKLGKYG